MLEKDGKPRSPEEIDSITLDYVLEGLHSIEKRNKGLIAFVQSYRSLTRIQKPTFGEIDVNEILMRIANLVKNETLEKSIRLIVETYKDPLMITADEKLLDQVLINLINNAIYAVQQASEKAIQLTVRRLKDEVVIEIMDSGEGIPAEIMNSIFIPFFTTKEEGSGIGLSLCRQIMKVHGGTITVRSRPGETVFTLKFPGL
jgi:signal transduction histidine kinase